MTHNLTSQPAVTHQFPGFAASSQRLGIMAWLRILIRRMPSLNGASSTVWVSRLSGPTHHERVQCSTLADRRCDLALCPT
jgi:hypothetical protein